MSEKVIKPINERFRRIVVGSFWVLLSLSLMLNVGKVARTLAFPFIYLFGASYYWFVALLGVYGVFYMLKTDKQHKKNFAIGIGIVFVLLGALLLTGVILINKAEYASELSYASPIKDLLSKFHSGIKGYYSAKVMNLYAPTSTYNSGLFGILLGSTFGSNAVALTMGIVFAAVGITFVSIRPIASLIVVIRRFLDVQKGKERAKKANEKKDDVVVIKPEPTPVKEPEYDRGILFDEDTVDVDIPVGFEVEEDIKDSDLGFTHGFVSLDNDDFTDIKEDEEFHKLSLDEEDDVDVDISESYVKPVTDVTEDKPIDEDLYDDSFIENDEIYLSDDVLYDDDEKSATKKDSVRPPVAPTSRPISAPVAPASKPAPAVAPAPVAPAPEASEKPKKKERVKWVPPSSELLDIYETAEAIEINSSAANERVEIINQALSDFKIRAKCTSYTIGSSVTRYNIEYDPGVSVQLIEKRVTDIARKLNGANCRFTPLVQGESFSGLEVPNPKVTTVSFKEIFEALPDVKKDPLSVGFGKDISGNVVAANFDEFPHLLVAGTTGSGKSIYIHSIITTLIMRNSPDDLKLVLVDPKKVEMTKYRDMPHLLTPIITEASKAKVLLSKLVDEMNDRYGKFAIADSCSNIKQYNEWAKEHNEELMPYIVAVLDEYADLVDTCKEISQPVVSIAQKARAAGIHLLISTQRPSTNVITGVIKGNLPTHVALMTSSAVDSTTIIGEGGAEKLLGKGDMLVQSPLVSRVGCVRLQGCFIHNREIGRVVAYLKEKYETVYDEKYMDLVDHASEAGAAKVASGEVLREASDAEEEKYQEIKAWVMTQKFVSMSRIQRECFVGFNRAGRFFNRLQKEGIVSTSQDGATKGCQVLVHDDYEDGDDYPTSDELIS